MHDENDQRAFEFVSCALNARDLFQPGMGGWPLAKVAKENLHRVALQISGRVAAHRMAFTALVAAVSGRCVSMLRKGLSMEEAAAAMPLLGDLWRAGLLYVPGDGARAAVAAALAVLVSGGRKVRKETPGSALGPLGVSVSRPSSTGSGSRETMDQRLRRWCRSCELFEDVRTLIRYHTLSTMSNPEATVKRGNAKA